MPVLIKKLSTRAREALANTTGKPRTNAEVLRVFKAFRKVEEARLKMVHKRGGGGVEVCELRSDVIDVILKHLWNEVLLREDSAGARKVPLSLVATGGYGRRHMNPCSDVDMLFLLGGNSTNPPASVAPFVSAFVTLMFDLRLLVGDKSTRSVGDTLSLANIKNDVKTALIEARLVAGDDGPFNELKHRFDKECMDGRETEFLRLRQEDLVARHAKHEETPSVQEPNVKNGCGGLRDYHNALWMTYAKHRTTNLRDLVKLGVVPLTSLRDTGARLSLDDFGTGYSSLSYLKRLPLNNIKIDQSFVRGLPEDKENLSICRAIVALARNLGFTLTAEGVESPGQARILRDMGCDTLQGFYIGPPVAAESVPDLLIRRRTLEESP